MKKLVILTLLVTFGLALTPGYASDDGYKSFMKAVTEQRNESGRPEVVTESARVIIMMFGLKDAVRVFTFDKLKDNYKVKDLPNSDSTKSPFHKEPYERLQEALEIYGEKG